MQSDPTGSHLGEWRNPPIVQDAVLEYIVSVDGPVLLREVTIACQLPRRIANRVLRRLHAKGVLTRYKIPVQRHGYNRRTRLLVPGGATRMCYLYSFAEEA